MGTHLTTRVKSKVDAVPDAELRCNLCDEWKTTKDFKTKSPQAAYGLAERYDTMCSACDDFRKHMRKGRKGKFPSFQEVREALANGAAVATAPALKQAAHPQRLSQPLSQDELDLVRDRREKREKENTKPDLCYLVGVEGEDKFVKIGHSRDPYARLGDFQAGNPRKLYVIGTLPGGEETERKLHQKFFAYHTTECVGEWFRKSPAIMNEFTGVKNGRA